jgi:hypothetical protein
MSKYLLLIYASATNFLFLSMLVVWVVTPCAFLCRHRRFEGTYCLYLVIHYVMHYRRPGAEVAQSEKCLTTDWTTGRGKVFFSSLCIQTSSEAHPASYTMGTGGSFPEGKVRPGHDGDHLPHLLPRSGMSRSYISSPLVVTMACSGTDFLLE